MKPVIYTPMSQNNNYTHAGLLKRTNTPAIVCTKLAVLGLEINVVKWSQDLSMDTPILLELLKMYVTIHFTKIKTSHARTLHSWKSSMFLIHKGICRKDYVYCQ